MIVDVDKHTDLATEQNVRELPTTTLVRGNKVLTRFAGVRTESKLDKIFKGLAQKPTKSKNTGPRLADNQSFEINKDWKPTEFAYTGPQLADNQSRDLNKDWSST